MSHFIPLSEGAEMTSRYRNNQETILGADYQGQGILPLSETFDKSTFETLLTKSGCAAIRIYYGMDKSLKIHALVVAVDASDNDILPAYENLEGSTEDYVVEKGIRCPDLCPPASPLNS